MEFNLLFALAARLHAQPGVVAAAVFNWKASKSPLAVHRRPVAPQVCAYPATERCALCAPMRQWAASRRSAATAAVLACSARIMTGCALPAGCECMQLRQRYGVASMVQIELALAASATEALA